MFLLIHFDGSLFRYNGYNYFTTAKFTRAKVKKVNEIHSLNSNPNISYIRSRLRGLNYLYSC